jgi:hypothetical protein
MIKFYDYLLTLLKPLIIILGHIGLPKRKIQGNHFYKISNSIQIGDVVLTKTNYEFSNWLNPTDIKHGATYVGCIFEDDIPYVFESTGAGAVLTDLYTFCKNKDLIIVTRFKNQFKSSYYNISKIVLRLKGVKYDYLFNGDGKAFYCFELCGVIIKEIFPSVKLKLKEVIKDKVIYDNNTFLDNELFTIVFDSRIGD